MEQIIIIGSLVLLGYLYFRFKKGIGQELIIAFLIAFGWISYSGIYDYRFNNYTLFGVSLFPLVAWTAGLVLLREIYENLSKKNRFIKITAIYIISIILLEYIGYNYWGIQLSSCHPGLLGFELMHIPLLGKIFYLTIGPIYIKITDYLGVK